MSDKHERRIGIPLSVRNKQFVVQHRQTRRGEVLLDGVELAKRLAAPYPIGANGAALIAVVQQVVVEISVVRLQQRLEVIEGVACLPRRLSAHTGQKYDCF